jgi:hypothetical protein
MNGWEILLGATLEVGLGLLAEAGFGDQVRGLPIDPIKKEET